MAALSGLLRPLDELLDPPALVAGERPALHDEDAVADLELVLLVVRLVLRPAGHVLAVLAVGETPLDQDDARLGHLVAGHDADELAAVNLGLAMGDDRTRCLGGHVYFSLLSGLALAAETSSRRRWASTVLTRAMSRRAFRISIVFSS